jgi:hypothetical protein
MIPELEEAIRMAERKEEGRVGGSSNGLCTTLEQGAKGGSIQEICGRATVS